MRDRTSLPFSVVHICVIQWAMDIFFYCSGGINEDMESMNLRCEEGAIT